MKIENIKVHSVNIYKLINFLDIKLPEDQKLHITDFVIFEDKFKIDSDCCFSEIGHSHFDNKIQPVIDIGCRIKHFDKEGSYSMRMDREDFTKTISLEDYIKISKDIDIGDFIRLNYNPRVIDNQKLLIRYIKESYESSIS